MKFILSDPDKAIDDLALRLNRELGDGKVLWLTSGGSNIGATAKIMFRSQPI